MKIYRNLGSFADYLKTDADLLWKVPDEFSFEDAAALNAGPVTAHQALFHPDRLGLTEFPQTETWVCYSCD